MYKELATIKDDDKVTAFIVYDGVSVSVMGMEEMKREAAAGNVDTLKYENGKFIPIIQGEIANDLKKVENLRKFHKLNKNMTFEDYTDLDCLFRQDDVNSVMCDALKPSHIVLADVVSALKISGRWVLTVAFWSQNSEDIVRVRNHLLHYKTIKIEADYGNFMIVNLPLRDSLSDFDLLELSKRSGVWIRYNEDSLEKMGKRTDFYLNAVPRLLRKIMGITKPTKKNMESLFFALTR